MPPPISGRDRPHTARRVPPAAARVRFDASCRRLHAAPPGHLSFPGDTHGVCSLRSFVPARGSSPASSAANTPHAVWADVRLDGFCRGAGRQIRNCSRSGRPRDIAAATGFFPAGKRAHRRLFRRTSCCPGICLFQVCGRGHSRGNAGTALALPTGRRACFFSPSLEGLGGACQALVWATCVNSWQTRLHSSASSGGAWPIHHATCAEPMDRLPA